MSERFWKIVSTVCMGAAIWAAFSCMDTDTTWGSILLWVFAIAFAVYGVAVYEWARKVGRREFWDNLMDIAFKDDEQVLFGKIGDRIAQHLLEARKKDREAR